MSDIPLHMLDSIQIQELSPEQLEPRTDGSSSVVVPMEDMVIILTQLWKSRATEPKIGELYEKYKALIPSKE